MQHQHIPVRRDNEICCSIPSCGHVLEVISEQPLISANSHIGGEKIYPGLDVLMIGSSIDQGLSRVFPTNQELKNKQRVLSKLLETTKKYDLPDRIAYETMKKLLKKNRGLYSYKLQIRALCEVINTAIWNGEVRYIYKLKAIKENHANCRGI